MRRTLYICYFGIQEPLVQTQVLPYLRQLLKRGNEEKGKSEEVAKAGAIFPMGVSLLTFEPTRGVGGLAELATIRENLAAEGIEWEWLPYHKRFSAIATAWDVFQGAVFIWQRIARFDVLHGRAHVAMLMGGLARKFSRRRPKLLFDIRGFIPEEYTDSGLWVQGGGLYRIAKRVEHWLMRETDAFVVLTYRAREILADEIGERPVEVIPCCVDFEKRFSGDREKLRLEIRERLGVGERQAIIHLGALGGLYLTEEIVALIAAAKEMPGGAFGLFLSQCDTQALEVLLLKQGFEPEDYFIGKVLPAEVEGYLYASDVGVSFVKATYATASRSPTKIPEYLACGLPIIANEGVGDVDHLIVGNRVGVLVNDFSSRGYRKTLNELGELGDVSERARETAMREFDLSAVGGRRYRHLYRSLLEEK